MKGVRAMKTVLSARNTATSLALCAGLSASPALAQQVVEFNCADAMERIMGGAEGLVSVPGPFVIPDSEETVWGDPDDPVSVQETAAGAVGRGSVLIEDGTALVGCTLIAAVFEDWDAREARIISTDSEALRARVGAEFLPILLLRRFEGETRQQDFDAAFAQWQDLGYAIQLQPTDHDETPSDDVVTYGVSQPGDALQIGPHLFARITFLGDPPDGWVGNRPRPSLDQYVSRPITAASEEYFESLLQVPGNRSVIRQGTVICAGATCGEILTLAELSGIDGGANIEVAPPLEAETITDAPFTPASPTFETDAPDGALAEGDTTPEAEFVPAEPPVEVLTIVGPVPEVVEPAAPPAPAGIRLSAENLGENVLSERAIACTLQAIGARIDMVDHGPCDPRQAALIEDMTLSIDAPLEWSLRATPPARIGEIVVTLPPSVDGTQCVLDVLVRENGVTTATLALEQDFAAVGAGAQFRAAWPERSASLDPVEVTLSPVDAAGCGGPARRVILEPAPTLEVSLVDGVRDILEVVHLSAFQSATLDFELALDIELQDALAQGVITALASAHVQLGLAVPDASAAMSPITFGRIARDGDPIMVSVPTDVFYAPGSAVETVLARVQQAGVGFEHSARRNPNDLRRTLTDLAEDAADRGVTRLHVNLFGPVAPRQTTSAQDICNDTRIVSEVVGLDTAIPVDLSVYTLVPVAEGTDYLLADLVPLSLPSGAEQLPSGLMRCLGAPEGVQFFPFFEEAWRSRQDLPARYSLAVGAHVAPTLIDAIRDMEEN